MNMSKLKSRVSNIESLSYFVPREKMEVIRWDRVDIQVARKFFIQYYETIQLLLKELRGLSKKDFSIIERFLMDGRSLINILDFFDAVLENDCQSYLKEIRPRIESELQNGNCYNEPSWILWKRFLYDAVDVLEIWNRDKEKLPIILKVF